MGSKSKILKHICKFFPSAENFYDVFGGGFSVSHFMIENRAKDFKFFHYNEIRTGMPELIKDAIAGKYSYKNFRPEFITREMFFKRIDEPYIKMLWSFGNNGRCYLFGKDIEKQKESLHNAIIFNKFDDFAIKILGCNSFADGYSVKDKRFFLRHRIRFLKGNDKQLEQLQQLQQLQQLERLERLERLEFYNLDYRKLKIKKNSVVYCDPPYIGTSKYDDKFNHKEFYDWAHAIKEPVFISEYTLDDKRFKCISNKTKVSLLSSAKAERLVKVEKLFVNEAGYNKVLKLRK